MRLNPELWSIGTQLLAQLTCRTKHVKSGGIKSLTPKNNVALSCIALWIVANYMENYHSDGGPYSSVH